MKTSTQANQAAEDDSLILLIKLRSGRFESSIEVPLFATDEERKLFVEQWLNLMEAGLRCGQMHRAKLAKDNQP